MIPVMYEFRRTLASKTVIIATAVIIAISVSSAINSASSNPGPQSFDRSFGYGYGSNGTYHVVVNVQNLYAAPLQSSKISIMLGNSSSVSKYTSAEGYANFTITGANNTVIGNPSNSTAWGLGFNYTNSQGAIGYGVINFYRNYSNPYFFSAMTPQYVNGTLENVSYNTSKFVLYSDSVLNHPNENALMMFYEGLQNQTSPDVRLYYYPVNGTENTQGGYSVSYPTVNIPEKNMTYYGSYSNFGSLMVNPQNITGSNVNFYIFSIFSLNGTRLASAALAIKTHYSGGQINQQFFGTQMSILGLFVPLMAGVAAYSSFGRDRTSGVIESSIVRPVTRRGLLLSRYIAGTSAVFLAIFVSFLVSTLVYGIYLGDNIPEKTFLMGLWALFATSAAYIGLTYLAASLVKSQSTLIGFVVGIFFVFDFLWAFAGAPILPHLLLYNILGVPAGSTAYVKDFVALYYISPAGLPDIASLMVTGSSYYVLYVGQFLPAALGLTMEYFLAAGILWIALPIALSVLIFSRKD